MDIQTFINNWLETSNAFNTQKYLDFYQHNAVLDDPSVGRKFYGHNGIKDYFESYFIGYDTHTRMVNLQIKSDTSAYLEVEFTGSFAEGTIGGTFDFTFKDNRIAFVKADLIH